MMSWRQATNSSGDDSTGLNESTRVDLPYYAFLSFQSLYHTREDPRPQTLKLVESAGA
jgi:hypothetical protein